MGQGREQIDVYEQPSVSSNALHYGVPGDRVLSIERTTNQSGKWNFVRFESGAEGWVQAQYISNNPAPPVVQTDSKDVLPAYGQLAGTAPDRSVEVFSAPSYDSDAPHYGISGDRVALLETTQGDDGLTWYQVEFESGAVGWISSDFMYIP